MGVLSQEQGAIDPLRLPIVADRLGDGEDVRLGECSIAGRATVAAGAEGNALARVAHVGPPLVVVPLKLAHVDQHTCRRGLSGQFVDGHEIASSKHINAAMQVYARHVGPTRTTTERPRHDIQAMK